MAHGQQVFQGGDAFLDDEILPVDTTAAGIPPVKVVTGCTHAYFFNRSAVNVWFRAKLDTTHGGAPDATSKGVLIAAGSGYDYTADPSKVLFIAASGSGNNVYIAYYGNA